MKSFKIFFLISLFSLFTADCFSLDLINIWRHSEIAGKNSVFCDVGLAPVMLDDISLDFLPVDIRIEYLLPLPLPLSFAVFLKTPYPNLKSFGLRAAYHFDLLDSFTDFYVVYSYDFGYLRNGLLIQYNDVPAAFLLYDFRIGVRRFFDSWFGLSLETGFHFESVILLLSIKIN
jgi:hypothetical protein